MPSQDQRKLRGKIELKGVLECMTGLHIGASKENLEIGALDSPVVRDPLTKEPYIPGSSLKGKLRSLLERASDLKAERRGGTGKNVVFRHECDTYNDAFHCAVCRLFGSTGRGDNGSNYPARIKIRDLHLTPDSLQMLERIDTGLLYTEWKFENALDRITSAANPRNLERVPKGAKFNISIVYDVEDQETAKEDLKNLRYALRLLEDDALGGHGSRGYGRVAIQVEEVIAKRLDSYREAGEKAPVGKSVPDLGRLDELWEYFQTAPTP